VTRTAGCAIAIAIATGAAVLVACTGEASSTAGSDASASDAARDDGGARDGSIAPAEDGSSTAPDASLPPLRDDAITPDWRWDQKVGRAIDGDTLAMGFREIGYTPPAGSEIYAAKIVDGAEGPAYMHFEAGGGAFGRAFWPASTVKLLSTLGALDFAASIGFTGAATVTWDSGFGDRLSAIYDRAIRVSSNIDYVRTFRVAGFDRLNSELLTAANGFPTIVLQRSYVSGVSVRDVPGMTFDEGGRSDYVPARSSSERYDCPDDGNCANLFELTEAVRRVVLDAIIPSSERFRFLAPSDLEGVTDALCHATPAFFQSGVVSALGDGVRICHKPGDVPGLDFLDHGVIEDASGQRYLLAAAVPDPGDSSAGARLGTLADRVLTVLRDLPLGPTLQPDAGVAIVAQLDAGRTTSDGRRSYTITIDAPGADRVELFTDGYAIGDVSGAGPRFVVTYDYSSGGERLLAVRATRAGAPIGFRSMRVMIEPP